MCVQIIHTNLIVHILHGQPSTPSIILSVYSPFSDRIELPLHNTPFPGVLMKSGVGIMEEVCSSRFLQDNKTNSPCQVVY